MFSMLSMLKARGASLADVVPSCLSALGWIPPRSNLPLAETDCLVLIIVDGLGLGNLERGRGHARFLQSSLSVNESISSVFPSTTSSALTTLVTGVQPNLHGILGYQVWNPARNEFANQLSGFDPVALGESWLAYGSLIAACAEIGKPVSIVGHPRFRDSHLTQMLYGKSKYRSGSTVAERFELVSKELDQESRGLFLVYISELDELAHKHGVDSHQWYAGLEELDGTIKTFVRSNGFRSSIILTADHGVMDVSSENHLEFGLQGELDCVIGVGGEPRVLQLKFAPDSEFDVIKQQWIKVFGEDIEFLAGQTVLDEFYLSEKSTPECVQDRLADAYVFAAQGKALYDGREPLAKNRKMVGQHGGITRTEMEIPFFYWNSGESVQLNKIIT